MKTKLITLTVLLLSAFAMKAQQGEIIYLDFEPDSLVELKEIDFNPDAQMTMDFDADGNNDLRIYSRATSGGWWFYIMSYSAEWEFHEYQIEDPLIPMNEQGEWYTGTNWLPYYYQGHDTISDKFAVRHRVGESYYYGWFRAYLLMNGTANPWVALDKMAYCTIQNYPLLWGQTSLNEGVEENGVSNVFANLHPNPTTGLVTIAGENLRQAEVLNMLGQQVLSVQGEGNELRIDMAAMPAGVYFVNVTNEEGRKCVRKVVKE